MGNTTQEASGIRDRLRNGLMKLVIEQGYHETTIQQIANAADIDETEFYQYYEGKQELLTEAEDEVYQSLVEQIEPLNKEALFSGDTPPSLIAFQHASTNHLVYQVMLSGEGSSERSADLRQYLVELMTIRLENLVPVDGLPIPPKILSNYIVGSLLTLITWWLENDRPYTPEYMSRIYHRLTTHTVRGTLQSNNIPKVEYRRR